MTRILIDPGTYDHQNLGDLAALQSSIKQLREVFRNPLIEVLTDRPSELILLDGAPRAVPLEGHENWFAGRNLLGRVHKYLPRRLSEFLIQAKSFLRDCCPSLLLFLFWLKGLFSRNIFASTKMFLDAVDRCDLLLVTGAGAMNDHSKFASRTILRSVWLAHRKSKKTAMVSQNFGPLHDQELSDLARAVLPDCDLICPRDPWSLKFANEHLGVASFQVVQMGDDAFDLASSSRIAIIGRAVGLNLRVQRSNGLDRPMLIQLCKLLNDITPPEASGWIPLPSLRGRDLEELVGCFERLKEHHAGWPLDAEVKSSTELIQRISHCRCVITSAYHVAVLALGQGIPAICVVASDYFRHKIGALSSMFSVGCYVVDMSAHDWEEVATKLMGQCWSNASKWRPSLIETVEGILCQNRMAYERVGQLVRKKVGMQEPEQPTET